MPTYKVFYTESTDAEAKNRASLCDPDKKPEGALELAFEADNDTAAKAHLEANLKSGDTRPIGGMTHLRKCRPNMKPAPTIPVLLDLNTVNEPLRAKIADALSLVDEGLTVENGVYKAATLDLVVQKERKKAEPKPKKGTRPTGPRLAITIPGDEDTPAKLPMPKMPEGVVVAVCPQPQPAALPTLSEIEKAKDYVEKLDVTPEGPDLAENAPTENATDAA